MSDDILNPTHFATDRTEEWRRSRVEEGGNVHDTAHIDIVKGDYVIVTYPVLAALLGALGFARIDNLPDPAKE